MKLETRLDPRLHLAAAVGWAVFALVTLASLVAANLAANEAASRVRSDGDQLLQQFAVQIHDALDTNLETRRSIVQATAAQIVASSDRGDEALRRHLEAVQAQFPEFSWLGVADDRGHVVAAAGGSGVGKNVAALNWFQQGRSGSFIATIGAPRVAGEAPRAIDLAAPLTHASGHNVGVLGAQLSWAWVERLQAQLLRDLGSGRRLELLLAGADGRVLLGPAPWLGRAMPGTAELSQNGAYIVGLHREPAAQDGGLAWTVAVRQNATTALATARTTRQMVFFSVLLAGLLAAAAAVWTTRTLMRRLSDLSLQAEAVQNGTLQDLTPPSGSDEVSRIGTTLAAVVAHLQHEKQALQKLNAELDARVSERTARIERLATDARHAAVTRERLRLARDLHDTLAHSLMALLTQLRLIRKLRTRWPDSELEAELRRAEEVAASGLAEARAAITQMRHNGVREAGLGPALQDLLTRFSERSGVSAALHANPQLAGMADERAETVFRIVEEALHNVERHARARTLRLELQRAPASAPLATVGHDTSVRPASPSPHEAVDGADKSPRVRLEICDDGVGFDPAQPREGHFGLRGIAEQAALIGARLEMRSEAGEGTCIVLEFDE